MSALAEIASHVSPGPAAWPLVRDTPAKAPTFATLLDPRASGAALGGRESRPAKSWALPCKDFLYAEPMAWLSAWAMLCAAASTGTVRGSAKSNR